MEKEWLLAKSIQKDLLNNIKHAGNFTYAEE